MDTLEVLRCKKCDAPLSLGDADAVTCPSCGTANDIPAAYRDLHRARIADAAARDRAEHVLRSLDRPPSAAVKVLARTFDQNMFAFMVLFGVPMSLAAILWALDASAWIAKHFHYASADDVPFSYTAAIMFTILFVFAFVPRAFGVYANRRVTDRAHLLAALAARPPKVPGAASSCRMCGAPLAVEPDKLLAVCSYCRAQNAVHLETKLVAQAGAIAAKLGSEVNDAAIRDRHERTATRSLLRHELGRYLVRTLLLGAAFTAACQEDAQRHPTTVSIIGVIVSVILFMYFLIRSLMHAEKDAKERRAANDAPGWIAIVGPIVLLVLLSSLMRC